MADSVIIEVGVDDQGTPKLEKISDQLGDMDDSANKAAGGQDNLANSSGKAAGQTNKMGAALGGKAALLGGVAAAALAAGAALYGIVKVGRESVEAFREQDEVNRALERSLRDAGWGGEALREEVGAINEVVGDLAKRTNFGDEALLSMSATFMEMTGSASIAEKELLLVADISERMGTSGEQAAQLYSQALDGNLRKSLARTTSLSEEQIESINNTEDSTKRAAMAADMLGDAFGGAAEDINPLFQATKNLEDAKGDLMQMIGSVIAESGAFEPVIDGMTNAMNWLEGHIDNNREAIQEWVLDGIIRGAEAVEGFLERMSSMPQLLGLVITGAQQLARNFMIWQVSIKTVVNAAVAFGHAVTSGVIRVMRRLLDTGIAVADFLGKDVPHNVRTASKALNSMSDDLEKGMADYIEKAGEGVGEIKDMLVESADVAGNYAKNTEMVAKGIESAQGFAAGLREEMEGARDSIGRDDVEPSTVGRDQTPSADTGDLREREKAVDNAHEAELEKERQIREEIASIRIGAMESENEIISIQENARARLRELDLRELSDMELKLEQMKIQQQLEQDLTRVEEDRAQAMREAAHAKEQEQLKEIERLRELREAEEAATRAALNRFDTVLPGIGQMSAAIHDLTQQEEFNAAAIQSSVAAFQGLAAAGSTMADMITDDREKAAKVEAAFNAAASIGAFAAFAATGFTAVPLGIAAAQHGVAAAQFALMSPGASGGGASSRSSASGGGGGGGSRVGAREANLMSNENQQSSQVEINVDMSGSTLLQDAPAVGREVELAARRASESIVTAERGL